MDETIAAGPAVLRPWRVGDEEALVRHANDRRVWRTMRDDFPHPYTRRDAEAWVRHASIAARDVELAITVADEPIGGIGLVPQRDVHRDTAEVGYWLGVEWWGRGIATATVRALTARVFAARRWLRLQAVVVETNPSSMRVLEKAGWTREGVLRRYVRKEERLLDAVLYAVLHPELA